MSAPVEARLQLQKDLARHLRAGHPWVFRKAIDRAPRGLPAGAVVDVVEGERFVARGYYDPHSAIAVRILTREPAEAVGASSSTARPATGWCMASRTACPASWPTATIASRC